MKSLDKRRVVLTFPQQLLDKPIIYQLIKDFNLIVNLLKVKITPKEEGVMVLDLEGEHIKLEKALKYLKKIEIHL